MDEATPTTLALGMIVPTPACPTRNGDTAAVHDESSYVTVPQGTFSRPELSSAGS